MIDTLEGECCVEDALKMVSLEEMQACAEEARGQLPHMNGKGGDCWVVAIAYAPIQDVKGWQPPLLNELEFGSHQC